MADELTCYAIWTLYAGGGTEKLIAAMDLFIGDATGLFTVGFGSALDGRPRFGLETGAVSES